MLNPNDEFQDQVDRFWTAWEQVVKAYPQARTWLPPRDSDEFLALSPEYCASMVQKALKMIEADDGKSLEENRRKRSRRRKS